MTFGLTHIALAGALFACLASIGGYFHGMTVGKAQEIAAQKRADDAADKVRVELQSEIDASAIAYQSAEQSRQENVRTITHESQKIIERPVYRNVCIDADGVGLLDRAASNANGAGVTQFDGTASAAATGTAH